MSPHVVREGRVRHKYTRTTLMGERDMGHALQAHWCLTEEDKGRPGDTEWHNMMGDGAEHPLCSALLPEQ